MLKLILVSAFVSVVVALPSIDQNIKNSLGNVYISFHFFFFFANLLVCVVIIVVFFAFVDLPIINELDKVKNDFDLNMFTEEWLDRCESMNESSTFEDIQVNLLYLAVCLTLSSNYSYIMQESFHNLSQCILSKINIVKISEEIKAATPKGDLDEVFAHYCKWVLVIVCISEYSLPILSIFYHSLMPEIRSCAQPLVSSLEICLNDQGDEDLHLSIAAIDAALDFLCYKGGERMASKIVFKSVVGYWCV